MQVQRAIVTPTCDGTATGGRRGNSGRLVGRSVVVPASLARVTADVPSL